MSQRVIRISKLASTPGKPGKLPVSPATIWRWVREGQFPKPFKLSESITVWDETIVEAFIAERACEDAITHQKEYAGECDTATAGIKFVNKIAPFHTPLKTAKVPGVVSPSTGTRTKNPPYQFKQAIEAPGLTPPAEIHVDDKP